MEPVVQPPEAYWELLSDDATMMFITIESVEALLAQVMASTMEKATPAHVLNSVAASANESLTTMVEEYIARNNNKPTVNFIDALLGEVSGLYFRQVAQAFNQEGVVMLTDGRMHTNTGLMMELLFTMQYDSPDPFKPFDPATRHISVAPRIQAWLNLRRSRITRLQKRLQLESERQMRSAP